MRSIICLIALFVSTPTLADGRHQHHPSPYAGEQTRTIKSLSTDDIAELRRGGGWGFAKTAELNGVPGPAHLLELKSEIPLTSEQVLQIENLFEDMRARAMARGNDLIALEAQLDAHFRKSTITEDILRAVLFDIAEVRRDLRYIHLSAHLDASRILSADQVAKYDVLRGYTSLALCDAAPAGHDLAKWRRHNGCE